ncbi:MAG TPA: DUF2752 domain-containing protein [Pirellulales bacterium]|nr:DUF2752 domain-containing protein [Pirellulales bacterium]
MIPVTVSNSAGLSPRTRFLAALVGAGLLAMLVLAFQLRPDPRGWGTHEQLGLPRCTFLAWVGKRCPACGMTTAWANFVQGRPIAALQAHVAGTLLAVLALAASAAVLVVSVRGKKLAWQPGETAVAGLAMAMVGLILLEWTFRLLAE